MDPRAEMLLPFRVIELRQKTRPAWAEAVMEGLDAFLLDHAANERKASATALTMVMHYPDRPELVREMIALAQEELGHFAQVYKFIEARGLVLAADEKDPYVGALRKLCRKGTEVYFLDRLLLAGIIEARGAERFGLLAEAFEPGPLKNFYVDITGSEVRHHMLFLDLARTYFADETVDARLDELLDAEAAVVGALPIRARLH